MMHPFFDLISNYLTKFNKLFDLIEIMFESMIQNSYRATHLCVCTKYLNLYGHFNLTFHGVHKFTISDNIYL